MHLNRCLILVASLLFVGCNRHFVFTGQMGHAPVVIPEIEDEASVPLLFEASGGFAYLPEFLYSKGFGVGYTKRFVTWNDRYIFNDFGIHLYHLSKPYRFRAGAPVVHPKGPWSFSSRYTGFLVHNPQKESTIQLDLTGQLSANVHYRLKAFKVVPYHLTAGVQIEGPNTAFTDDRSLFVAWTIGVSVLKRGLEN